MIDFKYPSSISEWGKLADSVEDASEYRILCGACGVPELSVIATELMKNASVIGLKKATEKYLNDIGNLCTEKVEIGTTLYLFLLGGCKSLGIEVENELTNLPRKMSFNEINRTFIVKNFEQDSKNGIDTLDKTIKNLSEGDLRQITASVEDISCQVLTRIL